MTRADGASDAAAIRAGVTFTAELARELEIPPLSAFGMSEADVPEMVRLAGQASSMRFNPVKLSDEAAGAALSAAISGGAVPEV